MAILAKDVVYDRVTEINSTTNSFFPWIYSKKELKFGPDQFCQSTEENTRTALYS